MKSHCDIVHGNMLSLLPQWAADGFTFDAIVTDPPYHLASIAKRFGKEGSAPAKHGKDGAAARLSRGFMGSEADAGEISFQPETWRACLDVLKPGGRVFVFGGTRTWFKTAAAMDAAGFEIEDTLMWVYGQGLVLRRSRLKPCYEPILLARKKGGAVLDLNIDECRVPAIGRPHVVRDSKNTMAATYSGCVDGSNSIEGSISIGTTDIGRWPGNLIHDGSDEVMTCFPDAPGQIAAARRDGTDKSNRVYGKMAHNGQSDPAPREDSGSAARFFTECRFDEDEQRIIYQGKAPPSERVFHCTVCKQNAFRADRLAHQHGLDTWEHLNEHATVKPVTLLSHLVKLITPPGGTVLDPFSGTFSTCVAAMRAGRNAVGIERDPVHCATGRIRLARE